MPTVWAMLGNAFYLALVLNGWMRVDDYVDGHGLVAMVPMVADMNRWQSMTGFHHEPFFWPGTNTA
jgi:hypothetical protein